VQDGRAEMSIAWNRSASARLPKLETAARCLELGQLSEAEEMENNFWFWNILFQSSSTKNVCASSSFLDSKVNTSKIWVRLAIYGKVILR